MALGRARAAQLNLKSSKRAHGPQQSVCRRFLRMNTGFFELERVQQIQQETSRENPSELEANKVALELYNLATPANLSSPRPETSALRTGFVPAGANTISEMIFPVAAENNG